MEAAASGRDHKRLVASRLVMLGLGLMLLGGAGLALWSFIAPTPAPIVITGSTDAAAAQSSSCVDQCQANHDRCRVQTKGSPVCDAERQRCLEQCLIRKRK